MITFKFDVAGALETVGITYYKVRSGKTGISQDTWRKIKSGDAAHISIKALNRICQLLDMQPAHLIQYIPDQQPEDQPQKK